MPQIEPATPSRLWRLSDEGRAQCAWLADQFAAERVGAIVSSAEPKAEETARLSAQRLGLPTRVREGLHENDRTGLGFLSNDGLRERIRAFFDEPDRVLIGVETANAAQARFASAIEYSLAQAGDETLAVVAHGVVITLFVARHNAIDPFAFWASLTLPAIAVLDGETFALERLILHPAPG